MVIHVSLWWVIYHIQTNNGLMWAFYMNSACLWQPDRICKFIIPPPTKLEGGILDSPCTSVCPSSLWISTPNFSGTIAMYMGRSLLIFSNVIFKMAAWRPYCFVFLFLDSEGGMVSGVLSHVCFGVSISNFICILMVVIGKSLLIFCDITFKTAAWQPFCIFWFPDS